MSTQLQAICFPLHGARLIEASAGTGKTWTIAALYVRLVLGHGGDAAFARPLQPAEILVMTFTRAATRELSDRVRARLLEAAYWFRSSAAAPDPYLNELIASYPAERERLRAAHSLAMAAEAMDDAAIFTIDAWCQRMLREHAFDSGSLFDEELVSDEAALFDDATNDYWRQQVYPLNAAALQALLGCWPGVAALKQGVRDLVHKRALLTDDKDASLGAAIARVQRNRAQALQTLRQGWPAHADAMEQWIAAQRTLNPKAFNGNKMRADSLAGWFEALRAWARGEGPDKPAIKGSGWTRLTPDGIDDAFGAGYTAEIPACFDAFAALQSALDALEQLAHVLARHAAMHIAQRMAELKQRARQFGFADMLTRLEQALDGPNGTVLRQRIASQFPVAMVDEFQDTSPQQYRIFDLLYGVDEDSRERGLFLIGDPKQSIYGFRGADIHSYLKTRRATAGRHYQLGTNFRSTQAIVKAVNALFLHAEQRPGPGAFRFKAELPFEAVAAAGRKEHLQAQGQALPALALNCCGTDDLKAEENRDYFAHHCAEHITGLLNDPRAGLQGPGQFTRLQPADIAILVRDHKEADAVRRALLRRGVASVYLSDKDSVLDSAEAADVLRWLRAIANPLEGGLARAAFASATAALALAELAHLLEDELAWEQRVEQLKLLHTVWLRQGVLAMLRRFIHELGLPAKLLAEPGGERRLTNLLHLAELLQSASTQLDGEQALVRWLAEQVAGEGEGGDEKVLRLESDAALVKVVTVHKSKGLEYPLVYLPFAASARPVDRRRRSFVEYSDANGERRLDFALQESSLAAADEARLAEDLRLMYVALTRARHFLWLGVAAKGIEDSAIGYLLTGSGTALDAAALLAHWQQWAASHPEVRVERLDPPQGQTMFTRAIHQAALRELSPYNAPFERNWSVASFSALARQSAVAPTRAQEETLFDEIDASSAPRAAEQPWHRFPRGSTPGNFLHEQLEWMAQDGFARAADEQFGARLAVRCERAGWANRQDDATAWLRVVAATVLPPLNAALQDLHTVLSEMEFWFPSEHLNVRALDRLCSEHLLGGQARPAIPERQLHGMLKGFADLVFEHAGRYWVLDYKSNALGGADNHYHKAALAQGMAAHRYDMQGAIYLLALHRLLESRLGAAYDPAQQLGGALFYFLRGVGNEATRGCYLLEAGPAFLDAMDRLLQGAPHAD